jgi:hypothetical protein
MPHDSAQETDPHVSVSFSVPRSIKEAMDIRIRSLKITRSDYLKFMVLFDLDKGPTGDFEYPRKPSLILEEPRKKKRLTASNGSSSK